MARSRMHRRYGRRKKHRSDDFRSNPPLFTDLVEYIGPGFVGFAGTRLLTRVAAVAIGKRKPSISKYAGALASAGAFAAIYFLAHRVKWLARWQSPLAIGSAIATLQTLLQYIPRLGWIVSDATPEIAAQQQDNVFRQLELTEEDPEDYTYGDEYDQGRMGRAQHRADARAAGRTNGGAAPPADDDDPLSELDLEMQDATGAANLGIFAN